LYNATCGGGGRVAVSENGDVRVSYRRRYGKYGGTNWRRWHESRREIVGRQFGGIDDDVTRAFFRMNRYELDRVFRRYEENYGKGPADYARRVLSEWSRGTTTMSGKTLERLLEVVPYELSFETKRELYCKIRDAYREPESATIKVGTEEDIALVQRMVDRLVERVRAQPLPELVNSRLVWLSHGDGLVARQLEAASEESAGVVVAEALRSELAALHQLFQEHVDLNHQMEHVIELPYGTITVEFVRPRKRGRWFFMSEEKQGSQSNLPARRENQLPARPPRDIFEFALQGLVRPEDSEEIVLAARRELLRLESKKLEGEMDANTAEVELRQFIEQMRDTSKLETLTMEAEADFKRASGTTRISVKKKSNRWWPFG